MAAENGSVTIAFTKKEDNPSAVSKFIAEKLSVLEASGQYLKHEVCEWSFLEGWSAERLELSSQLITYDAIDCVKAFCKEIIAKFPDIGFGGTLSHDWVNSEPSPTHITFLHKKDTKMLLWQSRWWEPDVMMEAFADSSWSGNINDLPPTTIKHWRWEANSDQQKNLPNQPEQDYYSAFLTALSR